MGNRYNDPPTEVFAARGGVAINADAADQVLTDPTRAIYIGGVGDIKVLTLNGNTLTFAGCTAGDIIPVAVTTIFMTGTTVSGTLKAIALQ